MQSILFICLSTRRYVLRETMGSGGRRIYAKLERDYGDGDLDYLSTITAHSWHTAVRKAHEYLTEHGEVVVGTGAPS